ncbi:MAG: hypothetical protein KA795_08210 [Burkholderiaceae bacterium]|nr:hypothetical protein [Burkholderiaceae bacterium]
MTPLLSVFALLLLMLLMATAGALALARVLVTPARASASQGGDRLQRWRPAACAHCLAPASAAQWLAPLWSLRRSGPARGAGTCARCGGQPPRAVVLFVAALPFALLLSLAGAGATPGAVGWMLFHGLLLWLALADSAGPHAARLDAQRRTHAIQIAALAGIVPGVAMAAQPWVAAAGAAGGGGAIWLAGLAQARWRQDAGGQGTSTEALAFALVGAWLGWRALPSVMLLSAALLVLLSWLARGRRAPWAHRISWLPALAAATFIHEASHHVFPA